MSRIPSIALTLLALATPRAQSAETPRVDPGGPGYELTRKIPLGGEGGWDYLTVDGPSRRVFVSRGTHVMVVDADAGRVVGDIPGTEGVHGIALAPDLKRGFTSDGRAGTVTVFDLATLQATAHVRTTGENPDAILFDPATKRVFTFNGRGKNATAIDAASGTVAGTVPLGGKPEFGVSDGRGRLFVNLEDRNAIAVIDAKRLSVEKTWPLAGCEEPAGLALDVRRQRLFAGCHNRTLAVVDSADGRVVAKVPIGAGNDAVALDAETGLVFASNGDGTLTIVRGTAPDGWAVVQTVTTQRGARTLAIDPKTHAAFLPAARYGPPPPPTAERPNPRPAMLPGSFELLVVTPK